MSNRPSLGFESAADPRNEFSGSVVPTVSVCQKSPILGCVLNNARGTGVEQLRFEIPAMSNVSVHIYHLQSN